MKNVISYNLQTDDHVKSYRASFQNWNEEVVTIEK